MVSTKITMSIAVREIKPLSQGLDRFRIMLLVLRDGQLGKHRAQRPRDTLEKLIKISSNLLHNFFIQ